jgi:hypothetical protein
MVWQNYLWEMVFANHINCYDLAKTIYCDWKMVLPDYNPCYGPSRLYLLLKKWFLQTI